MAEDIIAKIRKETKGAEKWVAAEYEYTQRAFKELKDLEKDIGDKKASKGITRARRDLRWVGRGEYRAARFEDPLIEDLKKLMDELPDDFKEKIKPLKDQIEVAVNKLKEKCARYAGDLKDKIDKLASAEKELEAVEQLESATDEEIAAQRGIVSDLLKDIEKYVRDTAKWMAALELDLKNVEQFETQINAWAEM